MTTNYQTILDFQKAIQRENSIPDLVKINGMIFTQDEYDIAGRLVTYGNTKYGQTLNVETQNRYGATKITDATVTIAEMTHYRPDIDYLE